MAGSGNATRPTGAPVDGFLATVSHAKRRTDAEAAVALLREITGEEPAMWGPSIVGFGSYHYRYPTGREGDMPRVGLSPRSASLTFYGLRDAPGSDALLENLGPHTLGTGCVYVKDLDAIDRQVLAQLVRAAFTLDRQAQLELSWRSERTGRDAAAERAHRSGGRGR